MRLGSSLLLGLTVIVLTSVLTLDASRSSAQASYPTGYVADGYTYRDGYWWKGVRGYNRSLYTSPGYYQYGYYYPGVSYYQYSYSHDYVAPVPTPTYVAPKVDYKDPGWRSKLLDIAAARDKYEGELRKNYVEQQQYLEALKALGLQNNFNWQGYGQALPYGSLGAYGGQVISGYNQLSIGSYGSQGQSVYGYSYNNLSQLYGDTNLAQLYQQANRLAENSQGLAKQATSEFSGLVGQEGLNRARIAEILAKGQAAQDVLRALEGNSTKVEQRTLTFKNGTDHGQNPGSQGSSNGGSNVPVPSVLPNQGRLLPGVTPQMPRADDPQQAVNAGASLLKLHFQRDCAACHENPKRQGAFKIGDWDRYDETMKRAAYNIITSKDEDVRMPRTKDGKAGPQVAPEIAKLYLIY